MSWKFKYFFKMLWNVENTNLDTQTLNFFQGTLDPASFDCPTDSIWHICGSFHLGNDAATSNDFPSNVVQQLHKIDTLLNTSTSRAFARWVNSGSALVYCRQLFCYFLYRVKLDNFKESFTVNLINCKDTHPFSYSQIPNINIFQSWYNSTTRFPLHLTIFN